MWSVCLLPREFAWYLDGNLPVLVPNTVLWCHPSLVGIFIIFHHNLPIWWQIACGQGFQLTYLYSSTLCFVSYFPPYFIAGLLREFTKEGLNRVTSSFGHSTRVKILLLLELKSVDSFIFWTTAIFNIGLSILCISVILESPSTNLTGNIVKI